MQRTSGQHDHLARISRTGSRQGGGRRSFAAWHWGRTTTRCSRGMEPAVRSPRALSAIVRTEFEAALLPQVSQYAGLPSGVGPRKPAAGNGIFCGRDGRLKIGRKDRKRHRRRKERNNTGENPGRNGLFPINDGFYGLGGLDGGDSMDRTTNSPPSHRTRLRLPTQERNFSMQRPEAELR
jgi:hypothetical protein